jgi:GTP-binding protein
MDIRHPFKDLDQDLIHWAVAADLPVLALLTKADKFKAGKRKNQLMMAQEAALAFCGDVTVDVFSSLSGIGLENLQLKLDDWFGYEKNII